MLGKIKILASRVSLSIIIICILTAWVGIADSAEKTPVTRYWMSVSAEKAGYPGMTPGSVGFGALLGGVIGKGSGDSGKRLLLQVNSPKSLPDDPEATHDIPPGQNMGPTLPLVTSEIGRDRSESEGRPEKEMEKPKMRMLVYWGCSETVKPGQPYVLDTEKTSPANFARAFQGYARRYDTAHRLRE
ncbi:MAG TPA: hypothetical protein DCZ04_14405 [Syntrophorhabdus aromaticivorans]|nr:hypothetical protein [Syntrophorhabdus aromaticivorans]